MKSHNRRDMRHFQIFSETGVHEADCGVRNVYISRTICFDLFFSVPANDRTEFLRMHWLCGVRVIASASACQSAIANNVISDDIHLWR